MTKQEIIEAINATIAPNNIKGITAESLNNVLTMMAENAGEGGSGDGALRVIVPELMAIGIELVNMGEFSPASWEETKSLSEQSGLDLSEYDAVVKASFEHNANVAQQILEKAKEGQGVSVVIDQTPYFPATFNVQLQVLPEEMGLYEDLAACGVQPAGLFMQYAKLTPEGEAMMGGDVFNCVLAPTGNIKFDGINHTYPSNMLITLNLDGSLLFEVIEEEQPSSGSGVVTFYAAIGEELPNEYKEKNAEAYSAFESGSLVTLQLYTAGDIRSTTTPIITSKEPDAITLGILQEGDNGFTIAPYVINADGSANLLQ